MTGGIPPKPPSSEQLILPLPELQRCYPSGIPRRDRVFCNRNLKMSNVAWLGFDMDYTLAIYNQEAMDELSIRATVEKLRLRGYPDFIREIEHPVSFPVRGLLIDKKHGHVLKMDRYKYVRKGYHGLTPLAREEIKSLYAAKSVRPATPRYHFIDTLYALSEVACYAALVESLESRGHAIDYAKTFSDIRECIDEAHRDGTILTAIMNDLPRYLVRDMKLAPTLHKWRSAGRKLFLLTNSRAAYTDKMMTYLVGGQMSEYPSWKSFFDVVVCAAKKPAFFQERLPMLDVTDPEDVKPATFPLERGRLYEGGNIVEFERALGVQGDQILYVGDHIYGDILRSKKDTAWRTALIIQELEGEIDAHDACAEDYERMNELDDIREQLEDEVRREQSRIKEISRQEQASPFVAGKPVPSPELEAERLRTKRSMERIRALLKEVESEVQAINLRIDSRFHPYWGSLLKDGGEQSSFGKQVDDYACVYTSRVSNFLHYSPQQYFRSPRDVMAHELG